MQRAPWWFKYARCNDPNVSPLTFTAARGGTAQLAKTICSTCPAEDVCLWYAVSLEDRVNRHSIFGGTTPGERKQFVDDHHITDETAKEWYRITQESLREEIRRRS